MRLPNTTAVGAPMSWTAEFHDSTAMSAPKITM